MTSIRSSKVTTAVEFLSDVNDKGYPDSVVRRYMMDKRGLTAEEVEKAFLINRTRLAMTKGEIESNKSKKLLSSSIIAYKSDRPEVPTSFAVRNPAREVNFLFPSKRAKGQQLINKFLDSEKTYCAILECLNQDYYPELAKLSGNGQFQMTSREVEEIFRQIPELLKLHKEFFKSIKLGSSIGGVFLQFFKSFEGYASYLRDCQQTVNKMRRYIRDTQFFTCLTHLSATATWRKEDMVDLLLTPLERFMDYKDFLDKLYGWADAAQTTEYEILGKASRRMGRVANYIEKYKNGICNLNEMNKVQKFLGDQCDILVPERAIVLRGMMIRRKSGWSARNKRYVFFLFSDMLLWTTKNGKLKNSLHLQNCEVMPSSSKKRPERKLDVIFHKKKQKTLRLECETILLRNSWYEALKKTIFTAKEVSSTAWSRLDSTVNMKYKDHSDDFGDDESKDVSDSSRAEPSEDLDDMYNLRYAITSNFLTQQFGVIDPMADDFSQVSEHDLGSQLDQKKNIFEQNPSTSAQLSPFERLKRNTFLSGENGSMVGMHSNGNTRYIGKESVNQIASKQQNQRSMEAISELKKKRNKSNIIRKSSVDSIGNDVEPSPQFTFRLENF